MKHKKWSRVLTWALCVAMVLTVLPLSALAESLDSAEPAGTAGTVESAGAEPMAMRPPTEPTNPTEPEDPLNPIEDPKLGDFKETTVAVNMRSGEEFSNLADACPSLGANKDKFKDGDVILIVRDCMIDKTVSISGKSVTFKAEWPVTVKRGDGFTGNLFSHSASKGSYVMSFTGPITIDGNKSESSDPADWTGASSMISINKGASLVIGSGVTLTNNRAYSTSGTSAGGAITSSGGDVTIEEGAKITNCEAKTNAGAVYISKGATGNDPTTLTIAGELSGNKALALNGSTVNTAAIYGVGGAVEVYASINGNMYYAGLTQVIVKSTAVLDGNEAVGDGGAIGVLHQGNSAVRAQIIIEEGATITNNKARNGGAISLGHTTVGSGYNGLLEIQGDVTISGNTATELGDGIYCLGNGKTYDDVDYANVVVSGAATVEDEIYLATGAVIGVTPDWTGSVTLDPETETNGTQVAKQVISVTENGGTVPQTFGEALDPTQPSRIHVEGKAVNKNGQIAKEENVVLQIYKNGNTDKPALTVTLHGYAAGSVVTPDITEYYSSTYGFVSDGWYNDGGWNQYKNNGKHNAGSESFTVYGWTNLYCMVTDYETVHLVIYRNGNTSKAYKDVTLGTVLHGEKLNVSGYDIHDYYSSARGFESYGLFNDGKWNQYVAGNNPAPLKDGELTVNGWTNLKVMVMDYETVHLVIYRNGDTTKPYLDVALPNVLHGNTLDVSQIDINDYYSYVWDFVFEGWYNDGGWNGYLAGKNPTPLTEITVNGWTNLKAMVTDWEPVEVRTVVNGDRDKTSQTVWSGKVLHGTDLYSLLDEKVTLEEREGYTLMKWYDWNTTALLENGTKVTGVTTVYASYEANPCTVTYKDGMDGKAFRDQELLTRYGFPTPAPYDIPTQYGDYIFKGWEPEVADTVTGDVTYVAKWELAVARLECDDPALNGKLYESLNEVFDVVKEAIDPGKGGTPTMTEATVTLLQDWTERSADGDEYASADVEILWTTSLYSPSNDFTVTLDLGGHKLIGTGTRSVLSIKRTGSGAAKYSFNVTVKNGTITGGNASGAEPYIYAKNGGGVAIESSSYKTNIVFEDVVIENNTTTGNGGGIYVQTSNSHPVTLKNCIIRNNTASSGGGVYGRELSLVGTTITENTANGETATSGRGGGIYMWGSIPFELNVDESSRVYGNTAHTMGDDIVVATTNKRDLKVNLSDPAAWGVEGIDSWCLDGFEGEYTDYSADSIVRYDLRTSQKLSSYTIKRSSSQPGYVIAIKAADYLPEYTVTYTDGVGGKAFPTQVYHVRLGDEVPAFEGTPAYVLDEKTSYTFLGWTPEIVEGATVSSKLEYTAQWQPPKPGSSSTHVAEELFTIQCTAVGEHRYVSNWFGSHVTYNGDMHWDDEDERWECTAKVNLSIFNGSTFDEFGGFKHHYDGEGYTQYPVIKLYWDPDHPGTNSQHYENITGLWRPVDGVEAQTVFWYCYTEPAIPQTDNQWAKALGSSYMRMEDVNAGSNYYKPDVTFTEQVIEAGGMTFSEMYKDKASGYFCIDVTITNLQLYVDEFNRQKQGNYFIDRILNTHVPEDFTYVLYYPGSNYDYKQDGTGWSLDKTRSFNGNNKESLNGKYLYVTEGVRLNVTDYTGTYDGQPHGEPATVEGENAADYVLWYSVDGRKTWTTNYPTITNVDTINVTVKAEDTTNKHKDIIKTYTLKLSKKSLGTVKIVINSDTVVYDGEPHTVSGFTVTTELPEGVQVALKEGYKDLATVTATDVGSYLVSSSGTTIYSGSFEIVGEMARNYNVLTYSITQGYLKITKNPNPITATETVTAVYDGQAHEAEYTAPEDGTVTVTYTDAVGTTLESAPVNAGTYTATISVTGCKNYEDQTVTVTIIITPAPLTVTVTGNTETVTYDGKEHTVSGYTVSELPEGVTVTTAEGVTASVTGTKAGAYDMGLTTESFVVNGASNYDVTLQVNDGRLTITTATGLESLVSGVFNFYGEYDGLEHGITVTAPEDSVITVVYTDAEGNVLESAPVNVGTYNVTVIITNPNYVETVKVLAQITIVKKAATVTVTGKSDTVTYDGTEHTVEGFDVTGAPEGLTVALAEGKTASAVGTNAGTYAMGLTKESFVISGDENYDVTLEVVDGKLVINKAATNSATIEVDANASYDGKAHEVTVSGAAEGSTVTVTYTDAEGNALEGAPVNAGTYNVTVTVTNPNYEDAVVTSKFTIAKKQVTITVNPATKRATEADPAFTGTVEGLVNEGDLGEITYSRTNADVNAAGVYEGVLTANYTANPNYEVVVNAGTLTITAVYTVTVKYETEDGKTLRDSLTQTYDDGAEYTVTVPEIEGYGYSGDAQLTGTVTGDLTVTLVYTAIQGNVPGASTGDTSELIMWVGLFLLCTMGVASLAWISLKKKSGK